ncbi:acetone carboxylase [Nocardioides marmoraquaticus]
MDADTCSAKGCQQPAAHQLRWNNPKLHTPDRRKVWLACDEHREHLADFLGARGFLREVVAHEPSEGDGS